MHLFLSFFFVAVLTVSCLSDPGRTDNELSPQSPTTLHSEAPNRRARQISLRVRNSSCTGIAIGSGWALDAHHLVTNKHVIAGATKTELEVSTWNGKTLPVITAKAAVFSDLAILEVDAVLSEIAVLGNNDPLPKDRLTIVGFPNGDALTVEVGKLVDYKTDSEYGETGPVMRINTSIQPGNSGSPVLNAAGEVIGIIYAIERATGYGLAIPLSRLETSIANNSFGSIPSCEL